MDNQSSSHAQFEIPRRGGPPPGRGCRQVSSILVNPIILVIVMVENTVLAVVPRLVLGGSTQGVVGEYRAYRVTDETDLTIEASTLITPHELLVDLVGTVHHSRNGVLVIRRRRRQHRDRTDRYRVVRYLRCVHA